MAFLNKIFKQKNRQPVKPERVVKDSEKAVEVNGPELPLKEKTVYASGILISPRVTEKSNLGAALNKYEFIVTKRSNKPEVKKAVEGKYGVHVVNINILNTKPKRVRLGRIEGRQPGFKKAIVTLKQGDKIELGV